MSIRWTPAVLLVIWISSVVFAEIPTIDGVFSEWRDEHVVARDVSSQVPALHLVDFFEEVV